MTEKQEEDEQSKAGENSEKVESCPGSAFDDQQSLIMERTDESKLLDDNTTINGNEIETFEKEEDEEEDHEFLSMMNEGLSQIGYSAVGIHQVFLNLTLQEKSLEDISFLQSYSHLQVIDFSHNRLKDITILKSLPYLISLNVSHNELTEVLDFTPPLRIREMNFSNNKITKINDLSAHALLHTLLLDSHCKRTVNEIEDIAGISGCHSVRNLSLSHNKITKISGLDNLPIKQLDLSFNQIKKIENIQNLKCIQYINLSNNSIRSLRGLQNHGVLEEINLQNNQILDLAEIRYLRDLRMLRILSLTANPIQDTADYRLSTVFKLSMLVELDGVQVLPEEKVHADDYFNASDELISSRDHMYNVMKYYQRPQKLLDSTLPAIDPYPMLIIVGPLGIGKKRLTQKLCDEFPSYFGRSIGHTTREPFIQIPDDERAYYFVTEDEFEKKRFKGEFIQTCKLHGYHYGISRQSIEKVAEEGLACVMAMELIGVMGFRQTHYEPRYVLVLPKNPQLHKLIMHEQNRYTEPQILSSLESVETYIETHRKKPGYFDATILSDNFDERYGQLKKVVLDYLGLSPPSQSTIFNSSSISKKSLNGIYSRGMVYPSLSALPVESTGRITNRLESKERVVARTPAQISYDRRYEETRSIISGGKPSFDPHSPHIQTPSTPAIIPYIQGHADMTQINHVTTSPPQTANRSEERGESNESAMQSLSDISVESSELRLLGRSDPLISQ